MEQYDTTATRRYFRSWEADDLRRKRSIWYPWWGVGGRDAATIFDVSCFCSLFLGKKLLNE